MIEYKAIKDKLEQGKGKGAKGAEQAYFVDGESHRERYSSRSQGQGRGRGGGRGRSSSRGRGGGGRGGGGGGRGGRSGGSGGVEESQGSSSGGADGGGGGDYKFPGRCFRCGHRGHQAIGCTTNEKDFVPWCARCEGWGHNKEKCATEEAVLAQVVGMRATWTPWKTRRFVPWQSPQESVVPSSDAGGAGGPCGEESGNPSGDGGSDGDPGDFENLEELKYDPADDRYPRGLEGKKLLWGASNAGPLRHGLESGRTLKQTREMQGAGEMPGPGETPDPEEALLVTILETGGTGIVEYFICNSLVKEQWDEKQPRRMEEMYRREMQEVLGPERQAFGAEVDASGSSQPLPDPQLSITSPIGQRPSDVEAVPMTYKDVMCSKYKIFWEAAVRKEIDATARLEPLSRSRSCPRGGRP
ncbi:unnamed protein product [Ectocarpus sp. CCAP 1310/34]|nr:unnamed protein product [Ectocarpus sp. CCAP 1310/34]